jgi:hypothetical protein
MASSLNGKFDKLVVEDDDGDERGAKSKGEHPVDRWRRSKFAEAEAAQRELNEHPLFMSELSAGENASDAVAAVQV